MSKQKNNSSQKTSWLKRLWKGGSNQMADELLNKDGTPNDAEAIVSPTRQIVNNFLERKLAVGALIVLICMFITMFVGPLFMPKYYDSYTEVTQKSIE